MAISSIFKAYDVRGLVPDELDEDMAWNIGLTYAQQFRTRRVVVGRDARISSAALSEALTNGLRAAGAEVFDIGLCGTEEVYFATFHLKTDGGIMITASHNPANYNGMKFVRENARPVSSDSGLSEIAARVMKAARKPSVGSKGKYKRLNVRDAYVRHVLRFIEENSLSSMKVVANAGNGCAGPVFDAIASCLPLKVTRLLHEPDGTFPNGVPNPLLPENRAYTRAAVVREGAQLGIAWDGDFDRCFFYDERGQFVEGYYLVGLLAQSFLEKSRGDRIVHDPRLTWNTIDMVHKAGGTPVLSRCGHAFIKEVMRSADAIYGGEMSGHHYFREFAYCDSGMIPWLLVLELISRTGQPLSKLVEERLRLFPVSGEINQVVSDSVEAMRAVEAYYRTDTGSISHFDGLSMEFDSWRFNLRPSNTEPLLRLNVESRANPPLMESRTAEILGFIAGLPDSDGTRQCGRKSG